MAGFIWQSKNIEHIGVHAVSADEAEHVVVHSCRPYPEYVGDNKFRVRGQTRDGRYLQVVYIFAVDAVDIDWTDVDLTDVDQNDPDLM